MTSASKTWGTTPEERQREFPCDRLLPEPDAVYYRGVTVNARPEVLFRWLCQMRVAPYSYDWIDNFGQRSPQQLTPGLEQLAVGQTFVTIFDLADFTPGEHITLRVKPGTRASRHVGDSFVCYLIVPQGKASCRLLVKLAMRYPPGIYGRFLRALLPWGDLVMMRRQLLNFKQLAERTAAAG